MIRLPHHCAVCGRHTTARGDRCAECTRLGRTAPALFCTCDEPDPEPVHILGAVVVPGAVECRRCHRPVL